MAWEIIEKSSLGGWQKGAWSEVPCISITRSSITVNAKFAEVWLRGKTHMLVCIDVEGRRLGFKPLERGQESPDAFTIQRPRSREDRLASCSIACKKPARVFADLVGKRFRAFMNRPESIIEVDLSPRNFA